MDKHNYVMNPTHLQFTHYHRILADDKTKAYPIEPDTIEQWGQLATILDNPNQKLVNRIT